MRLIALVGLLVTTQLAGCVASVDGQGLQGDRGPAISPGSGFDEQPSTMSINVTLCLCAHLALEWDRVAQFLPDGFTPTGHPNVPVMSTWWGAPEGTVADALLAVFTYEDVIVEGEPLPGGQAAMLWAAGHPPPELYLPPPEAKPNAAGYVWVGVVATDPGLVAALRSWAIPAWLGEVAVVHTGPGPNAQAHATVSGGAMDLTVAVGQLTVDPNGPGGQFERIVEYSVEGDAVQEVMYHHTGRHNTLVGPALAQGTAGGLGSVVAPSAFAQILWFGDDAVWPSGVPGLFRFDIVPFDRAASGDA